MARKNLIRQSQFPYHITTRTNNRDWFDIPMSDTWKIAKESLLYANLKRPINLHAFVLMNNHYHLLLSTPNEDIDKFMMFYNGSLSRLISKESSRINHKFSNRYKWTIVSQKNYLLNVYRYIYQNPLRANIVKRIEDYPYSSLKFNYNEKCKLNYFLHFNFTLKSSWFNKKFDDETRLSIKKNLAKRNFSPCVRTRKAILENLNATS